MDSTLLDTSGVFVTALPQQSGPSGNLRHCYSDDTDAEFLGEKAAARCHFVEGVSLLPTMLSSYFMANWVACLRQLFPL